LTAISRRQQEGILLLLGHDTNSTMHKGGLFRYRTSAPTRTAPGPKLLARSCNASSEMDGLTLTGVVIEETDGSRDFVNVSVDLNDTDMVTRSWISRGLQTLLAEGRMAEFYVRLCGAAGRVEMLDAVRWVLGRLGRRS
jgi:hypothetical protein